MELLYAPDKKYHLDAGSFSKPEKYGNLYLCQIGDLYCRSKYHVLLHEQTVYEVTYIYSGKGIFYIDNNPFYVEKGDILLNRPGEIHEGFADAVDPFRFFYMGFQFCDDVSQNTGLYRQLKHEFDSVANPLIKDRFNIGEIFIKIFNELLHPSIYSKPLFNIYLTEIILLTAKNFNQNKYALCGEYEAKEDLLQKIIYYIDKNLENSFNLQDISNELGFSPSYLSYVFSKNMGMSIKSYYNKLQLERALQLLQQSNKTITQIAEQLNYSSIHSFSRAFKNRYGVPPSYFRSKNLGS